MANVSYSPLAAQDLFDNAEFIARDKPDAAYRWVEKIRQTCQLLADHPEMGEQRESHGFGPCRSFGCGNYVIFYRSAPDGVEIVRIVRAERDVDKL